MEEISIGDEGPFTRYAQLSGNTITQVIESKDDPNGINGEWLPCGNAGPGWTYDGNAFHAPALVPGTRHITPLAFRRRFTKAERTAIEWAAVDRADLSDAHRMQAAALRADLKDQAQATYIDLDDPDVAAGVQTLEAIGLLNAGRAAEIIGADVQPEELP